MQSVWNENVEKVSFNPLRGDIKTDVLVIGGGICGILCAFMLQKAGVDCVLAEENHICAGVTHATTAKITVQHGLIYDKIMQKYGLEKARLYYESQLEAVEAFRQLASGMDVDFEICDAFVYSLKDRKCIEKEVKALQKLGDRADFCTETALPFPVSGAVKMTGQASFHPLKFSYALAKDLKIFEHTKILKLKPNLAITNHGNIHAKKVIVATHFPFVNKHGGYFLKMYQHRSYVLALKGVTPLNGMYVDEATDGLSFRSYKDLLLLGGGGHRTGKKGGGWAELKAVKEKYFPHAEVTGMWATQDCMTLDSMPYIGAYSALTPDLYVATGFNKWGMTASMVSAKLLTDMVCGKKNQYASVYAPPRSCMHAQLAENALEAVLSLLTPTLPRCPHMGCALKYNKQEHSWDCPCHGSRFSENGKRLNNPSQRDMHK